MSHTHMRALRGQLPEINFEGPVTLEDFAPERRKAFEDYYTLYDFERLEAEGRYYYFGALALQGYEVATHCWWPGNPKGNVLVLHGLFDHVGLFVPLIQHLLDAGYSVTAIDLPEHGLTTGTYGGIGNFKIYAEVLRELMEVLPHRHLGAWFAVAQSTGAAALLHQIFDAQAAQPYRRVALLSPLVKPYAWRSISLTYRLLHRVLKRVSRKFTVNSHDANFCEFLEKRDPFQPRYISVNWVGAMLGWVEFFQSRPKVASSLPALVVQGGSDKTVAASTNVALLKSKFENISVRQIDRAMHHLVREEVGIQKEAFEAVTEFFEAGLERPTS